MRVLNDGVDSSRGLLLLAVSLEYPFDDDAVFIVGESIGIGGAFSFFSFTPPTSLVALLPRSTIV
jgi:hypothetical protein